MRFCKPKVPFSVFCSRRLGSVLSWCTGLQVTLNNEVCSKKLTEKLRVYQSSTLQSCCLRALPWDRSNKPLPPIRAERRRVRFSLVYEFLHWNVPLKMLLRVQRTRCCSASGSFQILISCVLVSTTGHFKIHFAVCVSFILMLEIFYVLILHYVFLWLLSVPHVLLQPPPLHLSMIINRKVPGDWHNLPSRKSLQLLHQVVPSLDEKYRVFQERIPYNFESLYKCIQRTCTVFWTVIM
jgi:hypothetical protein